MNTTGAKNASGTGGGQKVHKCAINECKRPGGTTGFFDGDIFRRLCDGDVGLARSLNRGHELVTKARLDEERIAMAHFLARKGATQELMGSIAMKCVVRGAVDHHCSGSRHGIAFFAFEDRELVWFSGEVCGRVLKILNEIQSKRIVRFDTLELARSYARTMVKAEARKPKPDRKPDIVPVASLEERIHGAKLLAPTVQPRKHQPVVEPLLTKTEKQLEGGKKAGERKDVEGAVKQAKENNPETTAGSGWVFVTAVEQERRASMPNRQPMAILANAMPSSAAEEPTEPAAKPMGRGKARRLAIEAKKRAAREQEAKADEEAKAGTQPTPIAVSRPLSFAEIDDGWTQILGDSDTIDLASPTA